ncbi:helix-turn-helix domain-containing protein [[Kitasatospora] papulosa]|uniref:helix-turn-helix domain-containing protein n=1 Tax=[Kitasatospora] papulosa TaxID=1464011 RepID=UPI0036AF0FDC
MQRADALAKEVEYYAAGAVIDARAAGASWDQVARSARVSVPTARARWNQDEVKRRMERRSQDRAAAAADPDPSGEDASVERAPSLEQATKRLAAALSHLHRASEMTIRELAEAIGRSPSYVSRILSGTRKPGWSVTEALTLACGGDPAQLLLLWENAQATPPPVRLGFPAHLQQLRSALLGMYLAAHRPHFDHLCRIAAGVLTPEVIADLLNGEVMPDWRTTGAFVSALGQQPADVRPLWEHAHYAFLLRLHPGLPPADQQAGKPGMQDGTT